MSASTSRTNEVVDLLAGERDASRTAMSVLVDTAGMMVLRMAIPAGKQMSSHRAPGELTITCLEGQAEIAVGGIVQQLSAGQLLYLADRESHAVRAVSGCVLLLTVARHDECGRADLVDEASQESFPASDPPSYTP